MTDPIPFRKVNPTRQACQKIACVLFVNPKLFEDLQKSASCVFHEICGGVGRGCACVHRRKVVILRHILRRHRISLGEAAAATGRFYGT